MTVRPERVALEGGGRVLFLRNPASPFVSFHGSLPAGVAAERPGEEGVSEFLSRLLLSGTESRSARAISEALEGHGATLEFHVAEDLLVFRGRTTRRAAGKALRIAADCLTHPVLPTKELERVRAEVLTDLARERDSTRERAERELFPLVFPGGHPYGRDAKGDEEAVKSIEPGGLLEFHARTYGREGLILALAGDVDASFIGSTVAHSLEGLTVAPPPDPAPPPGPARPGTAFVDLPHKSQADIATGRQAIPRRHPDYYALDLANLLFGVIGMYGRLGQSVREDKGLAYYSLSRLRALRSGGSLSIIAGVNPERLDAAMAAITAEVDRLQSDPFSDDEIEMGRLNRIGGLAVNLERNAEVAAALHGIEFHELGLDYLEQYPGIVKGLSDEAIRGAAERYLRKDDASLVVVGPIGKRTFAL
ncbi:MAG TPA: pitrilysin family protein [Thermoplasmata archaeon]|nr:pitrilysin family protein [Thermoplasmata archaeon]